MYPAAASEGIGHNRPPPDEPAFNPFTPNDVAETDRLIALLKEQTPTPTIVPPALIAQSRRVSRIRAKVLKLVETFAEEAVKSAGKELGKRLVQLPFWLGILAAIEGVTTALQQWISVLPH